MPEKGFLMERIRELEERLIFAQADLFAREEAARTARGNLSYLVGALDEAKRMAGHAGAAPGDISGKELKGDG